MDHSTQQAAIDVERMAKRIPNADPGELPLAVYGTWVVFFCPARNTFVARSLWRGKHPIRKGTLRTIWRHLQRIDRASQVPGKGLTVAFRLGKDDPYEYGTIVKGSNRDYVIMTPAGEEVTASGYFDDVYLADSHLEAAELARLDAEANKANKALEAFLRGRKVPRFAHDEVVRRARRAQRDRIRRKR